MKTVIDPTRSREFCIALVEAAPDALVVTDADGHIIVWNSQAEKMFGWPRDEILGQPIELLLPESLRGTHLLHRAAYSSESIVRPMGIGRELVAQRRDGTTLPVEIALSPLTTEFGLITIATVRDVTERRSTEERLRYLSGHDTLTGLYNRHIFQEQMARLGRGRQFPVSAVVVDLDGLKEINDLHGHATGDEMLRRAATVLIQAFRADDVVARIGGDEFAALLPSTDREAVAMAVDRVARILREQNRSTEGPTLSLSIGTGTAASARTLAQCLQDADAAMYRNKLARARRVR